MSHSGRSLVESWWVINVETILEFFAGIAEIYPTFSILPYVIDIFNSSLTSYVIFHIHY